MGNRTIWSAGTGASLKHPNRILLFGGFERYNKLPALAGGRVTKVYLKAHLRHSS
jgi:hypothetical protein